MITDPVPRTPPSVRAFVARVRPERIADYRRLHADPWPEVVELLRRAKLRDYTIFLDEPQSLLFARWTYIGKDLDADMAVLRAAPAMREWHTQTLDCLVPPAGRDDAWTPIDPVFVL